MKANEGNLDRIIRFVVGLALIVLGFWVMSGVVGIIVGVVGIIALVTGAIGYCPAYGIFKFSTKK